MASTAALKVGDRVRVDRPPWQDDHGGFHDAGRNHGREGVIKGESAGISGAWVVEFPDAPFAWFHWTEHLKAL